MEFVQIRGKNKLLRLQKTSFIKLHDQKVCVFFTEFKLFLALLDICKNFKEIFQIY